MEILLRFMFLLLAYQNSNFDPVNGQPIAQTSCVLRETKWCSGDQLDMLRGVQDELSDMKRQLQLQRGAIDSIMNRQRFLTGE